MIRLTPIATVLSKNLLKIEPKEFLTTQVVYTIVNGKVVYCSCE